MWGKAYKYGRYIDRSQGRPIGSTNYSETIFGCMTGIAFLFILGAIILWLF